MITLVYGTDKIIACDDCTVLPDGDGRYISTYAVTRYTVLVLLILYPGNTKGSYCIMYTVPYYDTVQ